MRQVTDHHGKGVVDETIVERAKHVDLAQAGQRYLDGLVWRIGDKRFFTDKLPSNFLNIPFIVNALPDAKIVHMVRDPVETCFSNLRELFSDANPYSYDLAELAGYFHLYRRLMDAYDAQMPGRILAVNYADLVAAPEQQLRRVTDYCGLRFEPPMLEIAARKRAVVTASAVQARRNIELRQHPKWLPYGTWLTPLIESLSSCR
jgi:Sulfotransferase family